MNRIVPLAAGLAGLLVSVGFACGSDGDSAFTDGDASGSSGASGQSGSSGVSIAPVDGSTGDAAKLAPATPVDVVFTTDNAYKFGWGTDARVDELQGRPFSANAGDIFSCPIGRGPEAYVVPADSAPVGAYLYVVAWDDQSVTQGALGQFKRQLSERVVYTGDPAWEVCATGKPFPAASAEAQGPDLDLINAELADCTAGSGDKSKTSGGWVNAQGAVTAGAIGKLAVGEDNSSAAGDFQIACQPDVDAGTPGIDAQARWMWYAPDEANAFVGNAGNRTKAFLIFRLPTRALPPAPVN